MFGQEFCTFSFWWIFPIIMMVLCFFMMRGRRGPMMCGFFPRATNYPQSKSSESAEDILDKRYAAGDIEKEEYEEKKRTIIKSVESKFEKS